MAMGAQQYSAIFGAVGNSVATLVGELSPAAVKARKQTLSDYKKLTRGELGLSEEEKARGSALTARQMGSTTANTRADLLRGGPASAQTFGAQQDQSKATLGALAQAAGQQEQVSSQLAAQQRASVLAALEKEANYGRAAWQRKGDIAERGANNYTGAEQKNEDGSTGLDMPGLMSMFGGSSGTK